MRNPNGFLEWLIVIGGRRNISSQTWIDRMSTPIIRRLALRIGQSLKLLSSAGFVYLSGRLVRIGSKF